MPRLETTLLDRFVNGAFAGKRKIGRPLKYNIRTKGAQGWIELVFNPRTRAQQYMSQFMRFVHPYLCFVTYRFHVEKAREAGKFFFPTLLQGLRPKQFAMRRVYPTKTTITRRRQGRDKPGLYVVF